ncbi:hypothetical protein Ddc_04237 [Ditylenchus destructor]|nr:hypothetical protein Ddc_04237 [Ditylenchus destructor]
MENHLRFYKGEKDTLTRDGFAYTFAQELKNYSGWKKAYKCARGCHCRARIWTTGEWEEDANKRQYQRGISISAEHNHESEKSDKNVAAKASEENATGGKTKQKTEQNKPLNRIENGTQATEIQREAEPPKKVIRQELSDHLRFYKGEKDTLIREGFAYNFAQDLKNHSGWSKAYKCAKGCHCRARIWTTGDWEENTQTGHFQRGIFIAAEHNHEPQEDAKKNTDAEKHSADTKMSRLLFSLVLELRRHVDALSLSAFQLKIWKMLRNKLLRMLRLLSSLAMTHEKSEARPRKRDYIKKQIKIIKEKSKVFAAQGERPTQYVITATENGNTIFPILDKTIKENGQLVFLVDKPYFTTDSIQYGFVHGASKVLLPLTLVLETVRVGSALYKDLTNEKKELRNTASAVSSIAGGWVGGAAGGYGGGQTGAAIGGTLGAFFGGVGAVPGAAIGVVCGSLIGAIGGGILASTAAEKLAETLTNQYYGVPAEDVEILTEGEYEIIEEQITSSSKPEPIEESAIETIDAKETSDELNDKSASDEKDVTEYSNNEALRDTAQGDEPHSIWLKLPFLTLNDIFSSRAASNNCDSLKEMKNDTTNESEKTNEQRGIWQKFNLFGPNKDMVKKDNVTDKGNNEMLESEPTTAEVEARMGTYEEKREIADLDAYSINKLAVSEQEDGDVEDSRILSKSQKKMKLFNLIKTTRQKQINETNKPNEECLCSRESIEKTNRETIDNSDSTTESHKGSAHKSENVQESKLKWRYIRPFKASEESNDALKNMTKLSANEGPIEKHTEMTITDEENDKFNYKMTTNESNGDTKDTLNNTEKCDIALDVKSDVDMAEPSYVCLIETADESDDKETICVSGTTDNVVGLNKCAPNAIDENMVQGSRNILHRLKFLKPIKDTIDNTNNLDNRTRNKVIDTKDPNREVNANIHELKKQSEFVSHKNEATKNQTNDTAKWYI